ncbi:MAG: DUF5017 domain-containing protein, partial [Bacilli bacterium]|nr:DUF5017 domain-containing protein [Bacilli bacterium]
MEKKIFLCLLPLLASCSGSNPPQVIYHKITFSGDEHCYMYDVVEPYGQVTEKDWEAGSVANYIIKPIEGYNIPNENQVSFLTNDGTPFEGEHSYDPKTGNLSVKMDEDIKVTAIATTSFSFSFDAAFCELSDFKESYEEGEKVNVTLTADDVLTVPDDVTVYIGEKTGVKGKDYEYTPAEDNKTAEFGITISDNTKVLAGAKEAAEPLTFTALTDNSTLTLYVQKIDEIQQERKVPFNLQY